MNLQLHVPTNFIPSNTQWYYVHKRKAGLHGLSKSDYETMYAPPMEEIQLFDFQPNTNGNLPSRRPSDTTLAYTVTYT